MKWTVGAKIGTGFALALVILLIVGGTSYHSTNQQTETADWVTHTHRVLEKLDGLLISLVDAETSERGYLLSHDRSFLEPYENAIKLIGPFLSEIRDLTKDNTRQQQRLDTLELSVNKRLELIQHLLEAQQTGSVDASFQSTTLSKGKAEMDRIRQIVGEMKAEENKLLKERSDEAQDSARNAKVLIIVATGLAFVILSVVSFLITQNIAKPLRDITATAERISVGDLSGNVVAKGRQDEVGLLTQTFARMTHSLRDMSDVAKRIADGDLRSTVKPASEKDVLGNAFALMLESLKGMTGQLSEGINILSASANQISTSTSQLASSATETATAVSQTTTTVEEVRQTAQLSSQKAKGVAEVAQRTVQVAQAGAKASDDSIGGINRVHQQMGTMADNMVRLSEQIQTIAQIVASVEDLAAQSNILAVNASIEAAKAGEQGKGFAVVAQEVRSLAEQSKQATNQVRTILTDIQKATSSAVMATEQGGKAVEASVKEAGVAGQSIQMLSGSVNEAAQAATQIAASSQQQLVGVDQVASAMESIKQASSQNVASAKQLEASAHGIRELGQKLKLLLDRYKV